MSKGNLVRLDGFGDLRRCTNSVSMGRRSREQVRRQAGWRGTGARARELFAAELFGARLRWVMSRESKKVRSERRARNKERKAALLQPSNLPIDKEHSRARFGHMRGRGFTYKAVALV